MNNDTSDICHRTKLDSDVVLRTEELLNMEECPDAIYMLLDCVDWHGHYHGFDSSVPEYMNAIQDADTYCGRVMNIIDKRMEMYPEDWLVIVVTDHGGTKHKEMDGDFWGDHGEDIPEHRNIFITMHGSQVVPGEILPVPTIVDVPATAIMHLTGKLPDQKWKLDGTPIGLKSLRNSPKQLRKELRSMKILDGNKKIECTF